MNAAFGLPPPVSAVWQARALAPATKKIVGLLSVYLTRRGATREPSRFMFGYVITLHFIGDNVVDQFFLIAGIPHSMFRPGRL